jgi:hypothetical protein
MSDTGATPIARGATFYGDGDIPTSYGQSVGLEGRTHVSPDVNPSNPTVRRSQNDVYSILVRNATGTTLYAGQVVVWADGYRGKRVGRLAYVSAEEVAGVVDDQLPATGVRDGDIFHLIVKGPCLTRLSTTAAEAVVAEGNVVYAAAAATSGAAGAGRFRPWVGTFSATESTDGTAGKIAMNRIGRAMQAATTGNTGALRLVQLNIQA